MQFAFLCQQAMLKLDDQSLYRPEQSGVGRIIQDLPDDLSPYSGIGAPFHFDKRRYRVLVNKQMVHRPSVAGVFIVRNPQCVGN